MARNNFSPASHVKENVIQTVLVALAALQAPPAFVVQPYYVYPNDFTAKPQHKIAISRTMDELQGWFRDRVGSTFTLKPVIEIKSRQDYVMMRVGASPTAEDAANKTFMPNWFASLREAVGGEFKPKQISVIFAAGGGGYSTGKISGNDSGVAVIGDWFLEAESGIKDANAIPAPANQKPDLPTGILAARLGQAFGLLNPEAMPGPSLVGGFQSYPNTRLMAHETLILRNSPFFGFGDGDQNVPRLNWDTADRGVWGDSFYVMANGLMNTDMVEVSWMGKPTENPNSTIKQMSVFVGLDGVSEDKGRFKIPNGAGPGFIRIWRGAQKSNMITVNFLSPEQAKIKGGSLIPVT